MYVLKDNAGLSGSTDPWFSNNTGFQENAHPSTPASDRAVPVGVGVVGRNQRSRLDKLWKDGWMSVGGKSCTDLSTATGMVTE